MRRLLCACLVALLAGGCMSYPGEPPGSNKELKATLSGAAEVPPNQSGAGGYLTALYSTQTHILKWRIVVNGLSGPMTRGYFHGPDTMGDDKAALVELLRPFSGNAHIGSSTLSEQQAADLLEGRWYVDIQTEQFPDGEIRGTLRPMH